MPYWALVSAADAYAKGSGEKAIRTTIHSGYSTTISTFLRKTSLWRESMPDLIQKELKNKTKFVCCLDNNQKGYPLKFQRDGTSNKFVKVTGTCLRECMEASKEIYAITNTTKLLYVNQPIPSPTDMPRFELIMNSNSTVSPQHILDSIRYVCDQDENDSSILISNINNTCVDFSGKRSKSYIKILQVIQQLENICQTGTYYSIVNNKYCYVNHLPNELKNNKTRKVVKYCYAMKSSILQHRYTK